VFIGPYFLYIDNRGICVSNRHYNTERVVEGYYRQIIPTRYNKFVTLTTNGIAIWDLTTLTNNQVQLVKLDDYYRFTKILFLPPNKIALSHALKNTWRLIDLDTRNITTYDPKLEKPISSIFGAVDKRVVLSLNYCRSIYIKEVLQANGARYGNKQMYRVV
jgi:WD40 repeat protein